MHKRKKAIILKWEEGMKAPEVRGKGVGLQASEILKLAEEKKIPIVEDEFLPDLLFSCDLHSYIPEAIYEAVAKIITSVYNLEVQ